MKSPFGKALLRAAIALGFLGCLVAQEAFSDETAAREPNAIVPASVYQRHYSDCVITDLVEIGQPDEGAALEDSGEMLRVDIEQRSFGIARPRVGSKVAAKTALNTRPDISPPLLV